MIKSPLIARTQLCIAEADAAACTIGTAVLEAAVFNGGLLDLCFQRKGTAKAVGGGAIGKCAAMNLQRSNSVVPVLCHSYMREITCRHRSRLDAHCTAVRGRALIKGITDGQLADGRTNGNGTAVSCGTCSIGVSGKRYLIKIAGYGQGTTTAAT